MPDYATLTLVAALGLALGSFFNVCIYRLPRGESLVAPGSRCTTCGRPLSWYENIPLVSYAALGGRCRTCRSQISLVYPLIEMAAAGIAVRGFPNRPGLENSVRITCPGQPAAFARLCAALEAVHASDPAAF